MAVFRVEKTRDYTIMSNHHLRNKALSLKAKGLQSLMLSLPDGWDFTTKGLAHICKDGIDSITSALGELEQQGYLTRKRLRDERGRLSDIEYVIHEKPITPETQEDRAFSPKRENPIQVNPILDKPIQEKPILENPAQYNTNRSKTKESNTDQSIYPSMGAASAKAPFVFSQGDSPFERLDLIDGVDRIDQLDKTESYRRSIKRNIDYDCLSQQYGRERMDEITELMLETLCSTRPQIRIAADDYPSETVKRRLMKITSAHIQYVFETLDKHTGKIRNIKAYLLTALYNAPVTIDHYYRSEVNHNFGGI